MNPFPYPEKWPPNYTSVYAWRQRQLTIIRSSPIALKGAKAFYADGRAVEFIEHWMTTYDPRNAGTGKLALLPFVLFPKQRQLIVFLQQCLAHESSGLIEKCRDVGATWLCAAFTVWLWLFVPGVSIGWGSRKEKLVDELGDADSIFEKIRILIRHLPPDFLPEGFKVDEHMPFMRIINPENGATITGESGDQLGRGGRKRIYFKDESAHYERPEKIEAAISENTRVAIDISSVSGYGTVFERKRSAGRTYEPLKPFFPGAGLPVFEFDWRDHPEKTTEWYNKRRKEMADAGLLHLFKQEIDRDYGASVTGIIIKPEWIRAAIDAHKTLAHLGDWTTGPLVSGLDVGDGGDPNGQTIRKGPIVRFVDEWNDEEDTGRTALTSMKNCSLINPGEPLSYQYDSIGVGAGVKAEINRQKRDGLMPAGRRINFEPWAASAKVLFPERPLLKNDPKSPKNEDYFANLKAQAWFEVARRFERTWRAVHEKVIYKPDELVSLPSDLEKLTMLQKELAQARMILSAALAKMVVDKKGDGEKSPNMADSFIMAYWPILTALAYTKESIG